MNSNEAMTLEQYGNKLINEDLSKLVNDNPYFAFIVMSSAIEFIARCRDIPENFHDDKYGSRQGYVDAIDNLNAFAKYRIFNVPKGKGHTNKLYTTLRCGLLHAAMPNYGIILSSEHNDLPNNIVGCLSLYEDVKAAWEEIKTDNLILPNLQSNKGIVISENLSSCINKK
ncbi:MAG: hypothetical protein J6W05_02045 [Prevotella sp.]|nr:hypothetical protein [Prevotella sp.]